MVRDWTVRGLNQTAVYWSPGAEDGFGRIAFGAAVEIRCHWEDKQEEIRGQGGEQHISNSFVVTDRDLVAGGFLYLGTLAEADAEGTDPQDIDDARKVLKVGSNPTVRGGLKASLVWL